MGDITSDIPGIALSGNIGIGSLTLIPEARFDMASDNIFIDMDYQPSKSLASFILAAIYGF